ncbi:RNA polymerase sigma factor [Cellulophaga omnivescoria]|uniref:RNA polymerase sigma factor n=1 Tax=Cellulophaga omnivescoria TaxID=1888890 RepID=UPI0009873B72|nr:RNA polymerase sigma-70 factor [Cellulophaga omnivescoria]
MNFKDDRILIKELQKGNENAYVFLVHQYDKKLFSYALSLCKNQASAQDLLQNVFLKIWKKRKSLNVNFSVKSYLYRSVYNEFLNECNREKSKSLIEKEYHSSLQKTVEDSSCEDGEHLKALILKEIDKLPQKCKEIFKLSKVEGLTNKEISDFTGISIKTVEGQITKAYKKLRKSLYNNVKPFLIIILKIKKYKSLITLRNR